MLMPAELTDVKDVLICNVKQVLRGFSSSLKGTSVSIVTLIILLSALTWTLAGCSMGEEVKRIKAVSEMEKQREASHSTDLTGEQIFIRSCNTCHPRGRKGMGPSLEKMNEHFLTDEMLKRFIRQGKGVMPPQPPQALNDKELDNLVKYLRKLEISK